MDNTTQLFIRACKSKNSEKRLYSVYRRFYGNYENVEPNIAYILSKICDEYLNITNTQMIEKLNPTNTWMYNNEEGETPYSFITMRMLCSSLRQSSINCFPNMVKPSLFRKDGEKSTHVPKNTK